MALSNAREIRQAREKYKPTVGDQSHEKRRLVKIPLRGPAPDVLAEDAGDPEAEVEVNTWSSQAAYDKARADVPLSKIRFVSPITPVPSSYKLPYQQKLSPEVTSA